MEASQYKQQFLALLNALYPSGMEQPVKAIQIGVDSVKFFFYFEMQDFVTYQNKINKRSRAATTSLKTFEESLTAEDQHFLKELKIITNEESTTG